MITFVALIVFGYLCGSLSFAILVCRALGHGDPRRVGSGNPGTTNVLRHFGKGAAAATWLGDIAKGLIPVLAARAVDVPPTALAAVGIAAFLGHLYPIFFGFKGGKGVATLIGVLLGFDPWLCLAFVLVWLAVALIFRYSSLAALSAALINPVVAFVLKEPHPISACICIMAAIIFWRHRSNIEKLMRGTESKIKFSENPG